MHRAVTSFLGLYRLHPFISLSLTSSPVFCASYSRTQTVSLHQPRLSSSRNISLCTAPLGSTGIPADKMSEIQTQCSAIVQRRLRPHKLNGRPVRSICQRQLNMSLLIVVGSMERGIKDEVRDLVAMEKNVFYQLWTRNKKELTIRTIPYRVPLHFTCSKNISMISSHFSDQCICRIRAVARLWLHNHLR